MPTNQRQDNEHDAEGNGTVIVQLQRCNALHGLFYYSMDNRDTTAIVLFSINSTYSFAGAEMSVILRVLLLSEVACFMYLTVT